ncbi:MAG: radical SAM/SPASM domain-containing protein [Bdellovibrio sp.]|nr:radical SAM/SPASM domain-containing protein [Bdellovibrio sp.]
MTKRFQKINIEISNICNLQCSFCPEVVRSKKIMPLELFQRIIQQVAALTEQVCFHLMGDPLVHGELADFIQVCEQQEVKIFFVTNGVLLREKQAQLLLSPALRQVNFSLHSFHDNYPDRDPTVYLERIFAYTERALLERPDLYINYRLWNLQEVRGAASRNREMLARISDRFSVNIESHVDVRLKKSVHLKNRLYLHFDTEFIWHSVDLPILGSKGTCYGLSSHFGILVDGTVVPCCLDKEGAIPLGNIRDQEILEILDAPRSQALLAGFRQKKLVENLCQRCQYIERFAK